ncbi:molybdopterin-dependent oxidoreductase [Vibrio lentus]|nr:molybdopterin-dependent oxidoreductase [Vibrio lentus]
MNDNALIAWEMNGEPIPYLSWLPTRTVLGGRPASVSQKCTTGISIRNKIHRFAIRWQHLLIKCQNIR